MYHVINQSRGIREAGLWIKMKNWFRIITAVAVAKHVVAVKLILCDDISQYIQSDALCSFGFNNLSNVVKRQAWMNYKWVSCFWKEYHYIGNQINTFNFGITGTLTMSQFTLQLSYLSLQDSLFRLIVHIACVTEYSVQSQMKQPMIHDDI